MRNFVERFLAKTCFTLRFAPTSGKKECRFTSIRPSWTRELILICAITSLRPLSNLFPLFVQKQQSPDQRSSKLRRSHLRIIVRRSPLNARARLQSLGSVSRRAHVPAWHSATRGSESALTPFPEKLNCHIDHDHDYHDLNYIPNHRVATSRHHAVVMPTLLTTRG